MNQNYSYSFNFNSDDICSCGKQHKTSVGPCIVESGAINRIPEFVKKFNAKKVFVIADINTYPIGGNKIVDILEANGIPTAKHVFPDKRLEPNENAIGSLLLHFDHKCDMIVAFGSGVINDLGKLLAFHTNKPYIIVASAAYMDGYASANSSMARDGVKVTVTSKSPDVIIGDTDVLCGAPIHMAKGGLGDMLAKYIAICEWRIANVINGEYYCEEIAAFTRSSLKKCVDGAQGLLVRDQNSMANLFAGLIGCGTTMDYAGCSRPAAGTEHYYSHIWDMRGLEFGTPTAPHGVQCAIGTLYTIKGYELLKKIVPNREKALAYAKSFDFDAWSAEMTEFLGKGAEAMIALESKEKKYDVEKHAARLESIIAHWDEIIQIIEDELPSSEDFEALLASIEAPKSVKDIGLSEDILPMTLKCTKDIRDKYILPRLLWDLGVLDEVAEQIK